MIIVYYFAVQYINRGIDSWFDVEIEEGLSNAIELVQAVIEIQKRQNLNATLEVARRLSAVDQRQFVFELSSLRRSSGASEMTLFGNNAQILATSSDSASAQPAAPPPIETMQMLSRTEPGIRERSMIPWSATTRSLPRCC